MIIELSGIDGSGKTTQLNKIMRWANESGVPCYERVMRSTVRRILSGIAAEQGKDSWQELFEADAVELATAVEILQTVYATILPLNYPGQIIISDTYVRNWIAKAIVRRPSSLESIAAIYRRIPSPDLSIHLDVPVKVAFERILARQKGDHILRTGGLQRLKALADAYSIVPKHVHYPTQMVTSEASEEQTFDAIQRMVLSYVSSSASRSSFARLFSTREGASTAASTEVS
jgi:thymidylate kinase